MPDPGSTVNVVKGAWAIAGRDFRYDDGAIGEVKLGQVFQIQGHPNDALLVKHALLALLEPQPKKGALDAMPVCGTCGRRFLEEWQRDRCGQAHEMSADDREAERRASVHRRAEEAIGLPGMIQVGA
jgi:hypothetical protein